MRVLLERPGQSGIRHAGVFVNFTEQILDVDEVKATTPKVTKVEA